MRVLGMISGTSHDGIDVAVVDFELVGSVLEGRVGHTASTPYPDELRARLIAALPPAPTTLAEVCELDTLIGQSFAEAAAQAVARGGPVDLIVSHGQTVYHWVEGTHALGTLQIGQPAGSPSAPARRCCPTSGSGTSRPAGTARRWCRCWTGCCSAGTRAARERSTWAASRT